MSKMVSARIPDAVFDQASNQLEELGLTVSELVSSAFEYLIDHKALPETRVCDDVSKNRTLSQQERDRLKKVFDSCTLNISMPADISYDKAVLRESKAAKYEALA